MKKLITILLITTLLGASFLIQSQICPRENLACTNFRRGVSALSEEAATKQLPILMYHHVLNSRKGKYIVSEKQLESDFLYLKQQGYTTVFLSEVIAWIDDSGILPEKPIVLTFDDGHYSNMHYALPLAKKHDIKFMVFPVTAFSRFSTDSGDHSNPNYSHLTWTQIKQMADSGHVEFGNHSHNMHKFKPRMGVMRMGSESMTDYSKNLSEDIQRAQDLIEDCGVPRPTAFAYPFGKFSDESQEILLDLGFRAILTCTEGVTIIKQNHPESLHKLKRYNRDGHRDTEDIFSKFV
ncbi:MAG: polysaccharide deacetylase family protein [Firmicutes bacterium]|nr:polysaccharide deacetylase family protein [Bacillota bacterium]